MLGETASFANLIFHNLYFRYVSLAVSSQCKLEVDICESKSSFFNEIPRSGSINKIRKISRSNKNTNFCKQKVSIVFVATILNNLRIEDGSKIEESYHQLTYITSYLENLKSY